MEAESRSEHAYPCSFDDIQAFLEDLGLLLRIFRSDQDFYRYLAAFQRFQMLRY